MHSKIEIAATDASNTVTAKLHSINDFHIARSKFLDAFSAIEISVSFILAVSSENKLNDKKQFGQRIEELKAIKPCSKISKEKHAKITEKITRIYPLLSIRSDIVHSRMEVRNIDGIINATICNNSMSFQEHPYVRLLTLENFKELTVEANKIVNELRQILNQPSLPHPPSQGAAGGL